MMSVAKYLLAILSIGHLAGCIAVSAVLANDLTSTEIIQGLTRPPGITVRGKAPPTLTDDEKDFLKRLPPRGLARVDADKVGRLIDEKKPPSIDIEINFDYDSARITSASAKDLDSLG